MTAHFIRILADKCFASLRQMDKEATTILKDTGAPAGLSGWGWHVNPDAGKTEVEWTKRIANDLQRDRIRCDPPNKPYPNCMRKRCDLVVYGDDQYPIWIEIKGAWRDYWNGKGIYLSYLLYPLVEGLTPKSHTVPLDLIKLEMLRAKDASYVAELLVGFEKPDDPMDADRAQLACRYAAGRRYSVACSV